MIAYVLIDTRDNLPSIDDLVEKMWKTGVSYSKASDSSEFKNCTTLSLSWDKWIDDERWLLPGLKSKEYIYFDLPEQADNYLSPIALEIDDDALFIDKRAFYKALDYISRCTKGRISVDGQEWMNNELFVDEFQKYLCTEFDQSVYKSLTGEN